RPTTQTSSQSGNRTRNLVDRLHGTVFEETTVEVVRSTQIMRSVQVRRRLLSTLDVFEQRLLVHRVRTLLNDDTGTLTRRQSTEVSQALFGDDDHHVMLSVVNVR